MSDPRYDRDEPLAFDARSDRRQAPPRRGPAPVTLIISVLLLLGVAGGVAYLYRDGVRGADGPPRPVGASLRDVRTVAPAAPEAADPAAGLSIYKDDPNAASAPAFAAPPEQPADRSAAIPPPPPPPAETVTDENAAAAKAARDKPLTIDKIIARDADNGDGGLAAPKPLVKAVVQIGAFSTEALADKSFAEASRLGGGKMAGKAKRVVPLEKDGDTLYRVAITGFTSKEDAQGVCDRLKAAGKSCFVR